MTNPAKYNTRIEAAPQENASHKEAKQSSDLVQAIFVGTLLLIVLSVVIEYVMGDFIGLNAGQDFGLVLAVTLVSGICVGVAAAALQSWNRHGRSH